MAGDAAPPSGVTLPTPLKAKISVAAATPLNLIPDEIKTVDLSETLHFRVAEEGMLANLQFASAHPVGQALPIALAPRETRTAALDWDFSNWGGLGLTTESGSGLTTLLGDFAPKPLSLTDESRVSAGSLSAHLQFGNGWVTSFSYNADISQLDLRAGASPTLATNSVRGHSLGLSIAKHGLFGDADALGISVTRPSEDYFGSVSLADAGLEKSINLLGRYPGVLLSNNAQETDVALGYVTTFFHGKLALQANAGYQMNVGGQNGLNSVTVLSRAKINF